MALLGCGANDNQWEKVIVEGAATFDGKKVMSGDIRFVPVNSSTGPPVGAEILDGRYRVTNKGGVPVGKHRVVLRAFDIEGVGHASGNRNSNDLFGEAPTQASPSSKPSIPVYVVEGYAQYLPPAYNKNMALEIEITGKDNPRIEDFNMVSQ